MNGFGKELPVLVPFVLSLLFLFFRLCYFYSNRLIPIRFLRQKKVDLSLFYTLPDDLLYLCTVEFLTAKEVARNLRPASRRLRSLTYHSSFWANQSISLFRGLHLIQNQAKIKRNKILVSRLSASLSQQALSLPQVLNHALERTKLFADRNVDENNSISLNKKIERKLFTFCVVSRHGHEISSFDGGWEELYKLLCANYRKKITKANAYTASSTYSSTSSASVSVSSASSRKKTRASLRKFLLDGNDLLFKGVYTNGGCDGNNIIEKSRFWVDNLFISDSCAHYCSANGTDSIETLARYIPPIHDSLNVLDEFECLDQHRKRMRRRRKAIMWCFFGSRLPVRVLKSVDNFELESLLLSAIETNVDELVELKCRHWEKTMRKARDSSRRLFVFNSLWRAEVYAKRFISGSKYLKFSTIYNNFSKTRTRDIADYVRKYTSVKGIGRTIVFSVKLFMKTMFRYVYFVNHQARLRRVLELSKRKVRYKNGLLKFRNKIANERIGLLDKTFSARENGSEIFVPTACASEKIVSSPTKENVNELISVSDGSCSTQTSFAILDCFYVQRQTSFTCPLAVGAAMCSTDPSCSYENVLSCSWSKILLRCLVATDVKLASLNGLLPPIANELTTSRVHVIEFAPSCFGWSNNRGEPRNVDCNPILWFSFVSDANVDNRYAENLGHQVGLGLAVPRGPRLVAPKFCEELIYKLQIPRLATSLNIKLISADKQGGEGNIDCTCATFYGLNVHVN